MTARTLFALLLSAGAIGIAGCSSPDGPTAGELEVRLTTPNANDRAILLRVGGRQTAVAAPVGSNWPVNRIRDVAGLRAWTAARNWAPFIWGIW